MLGHMTHPLSVWKNSNFSSCTIFMSATWIAAWSDFKCMQAFFEFLIRIRVLWIDEGDINSLSSSVLVESTRYNASVL